MSKDFNYQITRPVAVLSRSNNGRYTAEVNYISYNGDEPKLDIRKWDRENTVSYTHLDVYKRQRRKKPRK